MRRVLLFTAMAGLLLAQTMSKQQKVERILELTQSTTAVDVVVKQVRTMLESIQVTPSPQQLARREDALEKVRKLVQERMKKVRPEMAKIYAETFTDAEIDGMLAFYESPAGRAAAQKMPAVSDRMSGMIQTQIDALSAEINKIAEDSLKK